MASCSKCGEKSMSFTCRYCGKKYCSEHRLPENHDCQGLETGKKEEYTKTNKSDNQKEKQEKWFDDKFKNKKQNQKQKKQFQKPNLFNETQRILKNNITLVIIGLTILSFTAHQFSPTFKQFLQLSPALTESAVAATNTAAQQLGYQGNLLTKTLLESPWTILTVMLVHGSTFHIAANMITFYFFGGAVEKTIGGLKMLKIYLISGIGASIGFIAFRNLLYILHGPIIGSGAVSLNPAVGASGAVIAMFSLVAMLYPDSEVLLYFIIPMKIKTAFQLFTGLEIINLLTSLIGYSLPDIGGFASSAHLTGLAIGLYYGKKLRDRYGRNTSIFNPMEY